MSGGTFYYDLGSPFAYLSALRVDDAFGNVGVDVEWVPVLLGGVFAATGRSSWAETDGREAGIAEVERRAAARGAAPFIWPSEWPNNGLRVMRAATWVANGGGGAADGGRAFALAAFAEQFSLGHALSAESAVVAAAERTGIDSVALLDATNDPGVKAALRENTERALAAGVIGVPSFVVGGGQAIWGDDRLEEAVSSVRSA